MGELPTLLPTVLAEQIVVVLVLVVLRVKFDKLVAKDDAGLVFGTKADAGWKDTNATITSGEIFMINLVVAVFVEKTYNS